MHPTDRLIDGDDYGKDCVDVTIVSPVVVKGNQPSRLLIVGKKAQEAQANKIRKHLEPCEDAGFGFKPFAADVFGVLADDALKFLNRLITRIVRENIYPEHLASAICYRKVSLAIQLGVARQVVSAVYS